MTEATEIKRDGARAMKNSGRGQYQKGDSMLDIFTVDYKEYPKGYTVNRDNWAKICSDAIRNSHSEPAIKVVLGEGNSRVRLWIVAEHILEDYIRLRKLEEESFE